MNIRFEVDPALDASWHDAMARRQFLLAPLSRYLRSGVVRLNVDADVKGVPARFRCDFTGEDINGKRYEFASLSSDGMMAIDDTVARIRRTLTRRQPITT